MNAAQSKGKTVVFWILSILLCAMFVFAGMPKILGAPKAVEGFAQAGYPRWFLTFIGVVEVGSGLSLLVPKARFYGAALLVCTMIGALVTHARGGDPVGKMIPAMVCLAAAAFLAVTHRPAFLGGGRAAQTT